MARLRMEERTLPGIFPRLFSWRTHQAQDLRSRAVFWAFRIDREHGGRHSVGSALPPNGMAVPFGLASFGSCGGRQRPSVLARLGHIHLVKLRRFAKTRRSLAPPAQNVSLLRAWVFTTDAETVNSVRAFGHIDRWVPSQTHGRN
jgi:hypothetical protein